MSVDQVEVTEVPGADRSGETAIPRRRRKPATRAVVVLVGALVLLLAGGGYALWALVLKPSSTPTTTFRTVTVATETLKQTVSASGTIEPSRQSALTFGAAGTVKKVSVEVGDTVAEGDTLATIDTAELEIARDSAAAELDQAEQTRSDLQDATDSTDAQLAAAAAAVKVKQSALASAENDLADATLKAPFAGTIAAVGFAKGDTVGSSSGSGSGARGGATTSTSSTSSAPSITLISDGTYVVDTSVFVADVASIKKGLQAAITPTGATDAVFGTVSSVGVVASNSSTGTGTTTGSATFPVTIKVTGKQTSLLPGSSATVAITVNQLNDVISVPTQAVSSANNATVVQKLINGAQEATPVTVGQTIGASTVITKGLAVGDQVVVASFTVRANQGTGSQQQGGGTDGAPPGGFGGQGGGQGGPPGAGAGQGGAAGQGGTR